MSGPSDEIPIMPRHRQGQRNFVVRRFEETMEPLQHVRITPCPNNFVTPNIPQHLVPMIADPAKRQQAPTDVSSHPGYRPGQNSETAPGTNAMAAFLGDSLMSDSLNTIWSIIEKGNHVAVQSLKQWERSAVAQAVAEPALSNNFQMHIFRQMGLAQQIVVKPGLEHLRNHAHTVGTAFEAYIELFVEGSPDHRAATKQIEEWLTAWWMPHLQRWVD